MVAADPGLGRCSVLRMAEVLTTTGKGKIPRLEQAGLFRRACAAAWELGGDWNSKSSQDPMGERPQADSAELGMALHLVLVFYPSV